MSITIRQTKNIVQLELAKKHTNGLDQAFLQKLCETLETIESLEQATIVILKSGLTFGFSSGLDLKVLFEEGHPGKTGKNVFEAVKAVHKVIDTIMNSSKIYVAAVHGPIIGSAASIVLACDLRIGSQQAWFWLPDPQFGGLLADGGVQLLTRLVGVSEAKIATLTNERINARTAQNWGLFWDVVKVEDLDHCCGRLTEKLSGYSADTLRLTKQLISKHQAVAFEEEALNTIVNSETMYLRLKSYVGAKSE